MKIFSPKTGKSPSRNTLLIDGEKKERKMNMKVTQKNLQDMADYYCRKVFYGIPKVKVTYINCKGSMGLFNLSPADGYLESEDDIRDEYLYRPKYIEIEPFVGYYANRDFAWQDPENYPKVDIFISKSLSDDIQKLTATLLHELSHYYLWYIGYDYHDDQKQFLYFCDQMGFPTNYRQKWTGRRWVDTYDYSQMDKYIEMYEEERAAA